MAEPRSVRPLPFSRAATLPRLDARLLVALGGILAVAIALRFFHLTEDGFWLDEGVSIRIARLDLIELGRASAGDTHPPLYYLLLHIWMALFGDSELAIRSLSAVIGVLVVPVVFLLGRALAGTAVGLAAALFSAISPLQIQYSQEARNYILLALLAGLSFLALVRFLAAPSRWTTIAYIAATACMLYAHVWGLFILAAQSCFLAAHVLGLEAGPDRRAELARYVRAQGATLLLYAPWLFVIAHHTRDEAAGDKAQLGWISKPDAASLADTLIAYAGTKGGLVVVGTLALAALVVARERLRTQATALLLCWLAIPILVPFALSFGLFSLYQVKYTIASSLAFLLLAAMFCFVFRQRLVHLVALVAVVVPLALGTADYFHSYRKEDWRGAAEYIGSHASPGDLVLFDVPYIQGNAFGYYFTRTDLIERPGSDGLLIGRPPHAAERVWVVTARPNAPDSSVPTELAHSYELSLTPRFYKVGVALYVLPEHPR